MFDLELTSAGESLLDGKKQNSWEAMDIYAKVL
jgi:hypothetical protein